jgi:hypothetical protein
VREAAIDADNNRTERKSRALHALHPPFYFLKHSF